MSAITRSRLARGTKLTKSHIVTPMQSAATALGGLISKDQIVENKGTFRLNFHIPFLDSGLFSHSSTPGHGGHYQIPFTLPPLQDQFSTTGHTSTTTPSIVLDEIGISFDQRAEPAAIAGLSSVDSVGVSDTGALNYQDAGTVLDFTVAILEKRMLIFDSAAELVPEKEIVSVHMTPGLFTDTDERQNPYVLTGLERLINPYRTYVLSIDGNDLGNGLASIYSALVSLQISLKFRTDLTVRDTVALDHLQNVPTKHNGNKTAATVTITAPADNSLIKADDATSGVQTSLATLDKVFLEKLRGGYDEFSEVPPTEHLQHDGCYEVIAVPLFGFGQAITSNGVSAVTNPANPSRLPYVGAAPYQGLTGDRRIIPLKYPIVIHHVIAVVNWACNPSLNSVKATSANFTMKIGVGLGTGLRSDDYDYQQVAYVSVTPATIGNYVIDRIKERAGGTMSDGAYDQEMIYVPIVYDGGGAGPYGTHYTLPGGSESGPPVFAGRATTATRARTQIPPTVGGTLGTSLVAGAENYLEVRFTIRDSVGGLGSYAAKTTILGACGHWVLICCRKHLAGDR